DHVRHRHRRRRRRHAAAAGADQCPPWRADPWRPVRLVRLLPRRHLPARGGAAVCAHPAAARATGRLAAGLDLGRWRHRRQPGAGGHRPGAEAWCGGAVLPGRARPGARLAAARPLRRARPATARRPRAHRRRAAGDRRRRPGGEAVAAMSPLQDLPQGMVHALEAAYARPARAYHNFNHVNEVLRHYQAVADGPGWVRPMDVRLAVLYHDAVYEAGRSDNEARSAALAREEIARWLPGADVDAARVAELIELTARHGQHRREDFDASPHADATRHFLDCDMAILGAEPAVFDAYD